MTTGHHDAPTRRLSRRQVDNLKAEPHEAQLCEEWSSKTLLGSPIPLAQAWRHAKTTGRS